MEFQELQQIVESTARSVQALGYAIADLTHDIEELKDIQREAADERAELRRATIGIANMIVFFGRGSPYYPPQTQQHRK